MTKPTMSPTFAAKNKTFSINNIINNWKSLFNIDGPITYVVKTGVIQEGTETRDSSSKHQAPDETMTMFKCSRILDFIEITDLFKKISIDIKSSLKVDKNRRMHAFRSVKSLKRHTVK